MLLPALQRLLAGVALGVLVAVVTSGVLRGMLFGVEPIDAMTYVTVTVLVSAVVMAASYVPARRAAHADALASLRCE